MQTLYIGDSTDPIEVVRSWSDMANGAQNIIIHEFKNGNFGYANGDLIKSEAEVEKLPEVHRKRVISWLKNRQPEKAKEKDALRKAELLGMKKEQLMLLAGVSPDFKGKNDDLVAMILEKEEK